MSATQSMYEYLRAGNSVTARAARTMFKVEHISTIIYRLRNEGVPVYTNRVTNSRGQEVFEYRIGSPNRLFAQNMASRHRARARRALYSQALSI
jgi:Helix-turn-helix domain